MAKIVLDTNFILACIENKLDFEEEILEKGHVILIPKQVIQEIERIKNSTKQIKVRDAAELALKILGSVNYKEVEIYGKYVDKGLKKYCSENPEVILGTMDKELKKSVSNRKMVIRNRKKLELQ